MNPFPPLVRYSLLALALAPWASPAADTALVKKEDVLASLKEFGPAWEAKVKSTKTRLFFSDQQWPAVAKGVEALPENRVPLREAFYGAMEATLTAPLPEYLPPEQMVGKHGTAKTLYSAQEELWQREVGNQIFGLAVAARLKPGDVRYGAKLHDLTMRALAFETWGRASSKMGNNADLAAGHLARGIALAYDWHPGLFTDAERQEIRRVIAERMPSLLAGLYGNAFWARGYAENHNHVSVAALGFCGVAFYDEIPAAPEWLAAARLNFQEVSRHFPPDGSSAEGVSYWTYGMSFILQYIEAVRPIIDAGDLYQTDFLKNAAAYRLMASASGFTGNLPWGDATPKDVWGGPQHILFRLAAEHQDKDAAWLADRLPFPKNSGQDDRALQVLWGREAPRDGAGPKKLDAHLGFSDLVTTRSGWEATDYMLAIKSGPTNRNHSHLDAGALALAFGEEWVLIASGYGKGSGDKDFWHSGGPRWKYFSNATESHATLLVNGKNQRFTKDARGTVTRFFSAPEYNWTGIDLAKAYEDVQSIERGVLHRRGDYILVFDRVTAAEPVTVEWLGQFRKDPVAEADGALLAKGTNGRLLVKMLTPEAPFTKREPTTPKVDVDRTKHFTYAAKQTGTAVRFTSMLQPIVSGQPTVNLGARQDGDRVTITGEGWTDQIAHAESAKEFTFGEVKVSGRLAVVRESGENVKSVLALGATSIQIKGVIFTSPTPTDLALQLSPDGAWQVSASRDVQAEFTAPPTQKLVFLPQRP